MNRSLCCLLFAAVSLTTGCRDELDHELDRTIRELNDVIRNEAVYVERRHRIIRKYRDIADTTRSKRTRAWAYTTLAGHYSHFQLDSSAYYCRMARALAEELGDERLINDAKVRTAIVLIGNVAPTTDFPLQVVVTRQLSIFGSCASAGEYPQCLDLIADGKVDVDSMISKKVPLADGDLWMNKIYNGEDGLTKIAFICDETLDE